MRRALHAAGFRFRLHRRIAQGCNPDLVLPGPRVAVFVDGDYWHGCPTHFPERRPGGPNAQLWQQKFRRTRERDALAIHAGEEAGWTVLRIWECVIRESPEAAVALVAEAVSSSNT